MWNAFHGLLLTVSPNHSWLDYLLVAVGVGIGYAFQGKIKHDMILLRWVSTSACLYAIHTDFKVPSDILFIATIPLVYLKWPTSNKINLIWTLAFVVNYVIADDLNPSHRSWMSGFYAALAMAFSNNSLFTIAIILSRFLAPRAVHSLYGIILCCHRKTCRDFGKPIQDILFVLGCYLLAHYSHFAFLIGILFLAVISLLFRI